MRNFIKIAVAISLVFFLLPSAYAKSGGGSGGSGVSTKGGTGDKGGAKRRAKSVYAKKITYKAGELDNEFSSKVIAREQAKQAIFEQMADTVGKWSKQGKKKSSKQGKKEKSTKQLDSLPSREVLIAMFSCLVRTETVKDKWRNNRLSYKAEAKPKLREMMKLIGTLADQKGPTEDLIANRASAIRTLEEIERIGAEVASSSDREGQQAAYDMAVKRLHATDWYERASTSMLVEEYDQAIDGYTKAIEYDPELLNAYVMRGRLYHRHLKDNKKALLDFLRVSRAHYNRGVESYQSKDYRECVKSLDESVKYSARDAEAYYQRAVCKIASGDQDTVKEDLVTAAKLGHGAAQKVLSAKGIEW
jgi:tetratricopeptide (TPR) repeat protein